MLYIHNADFFFSRAHIIESINCRRRRIKAYDLKRGAATRHNIIDTICRYSKQFRQCWSRQRNVYLSPRRYANKYTRKLAGVRVQVYACDTQQLHYFRYFHFNNYDKIVRIEIIISDYCLFTCFSFIFLSIAETGRYMNNNRVHDYCQTY